MNDFSDLPDIKREATPPPLHNDFEDLPDIKPKKNEDEDLSNAVRLASAVGSGAATSVAAIPGMVGSLQSLVERGGDYLRNKGYLPPVPQDSFFRKKLPTMEQTVATARELSGGGNPSVFDFVPRSKAEEYAYTVGGFLPGAGRNLLRMGVLPALASEAAGQVTKGTPVEPWARGVGGIVGGGNAAIALRPTTAESIVARAARGMTRPQVLAMETLMRDAQAAGIPLTRAEAAQAVTGGATGLANVQRVVEGQGGLTNMMAQRPAQIEAAGRRAIGELAPATAEPATIGPQAAKAAEGTIKDVQAAINRRTEPLYAEAATRRVGPQVQAALIGDPIYARALKEVRENPELNAKIARLPDDSVGVIDLVQRRLRERSQNAAAPGQASTSNLAAANLGEARTAPIAAAERVSPEYRVAREQQTQMREKYLAPLTAGPLGKIMGAPDTKRAITALFPENPVPGSAHEVLTAVSALSKRSPTAAQQLVRAHVESVFNRATKDLQTGPSGFGGASFRSQLVGNTQQAENLAAAIRGLPNGKAVLPGFDRLLEIMEATGQRQRIGSQTAFNAEMQSLMKGGGPAGEAAALAAGVGAKLPARVLEKFKEWNLGRNTDQLARLLTDPSATGLFRTLAEAPSGSKRALVAATRLGALGSRSSHNKPAERRQEAAEGKINLAEGP